MQSEEQIQSITETLSLFLKQFNQYSDEIFGQHRRGRLDQLRTKLQQKEPIVTDLLIQILGEGQVVISSVAHSQAISHRSLLPTALLGGNNELTHNFYGYKGPVNNLLNRALGTIEAGLWPPKEPSPVLIIRDDELRTRCSDLLRAPGAYDRVIREVTTILEDRIRSKPSHETLTRLIPNSADQIGENLVNKLLNPDQPVLLISDDKSKRVAFHKVLIGVFSYLRNPYHHQIDPNTEWSWAWSSVGFIDNLLAAIDDCTVVE